MDFIRQAWEFNKPLFIVVVVASVLLLGIGILAWEVDVLVQYFLGIGVGVFFGLWMRKIRAS